MKYSSKKTCKETAETEQPGETVDMIASPNYILFYTAKREGVDATGQTYSTLRDPDMAKAEAITKLMDLGYSKIDIIAIETAGKKAQSLETVYDSPAIDIHEVFAD